MNQINNNILEAYAAFELDVREITDTLFNPACTSCIKPCCKIEMCLESLESPFLVCLQKAFPPPVRYDKRTGWLTPDGCALTVGRPPVCHEFLCNRITGRLSGTEHQYIANALSYLVTHMGKRILGSRHIVEIMDSDKLNKIEASRFNKRLLEARLALNEIKFFYKTNHLQSESIKILSRICPPPSAVRIAEAPEESHITLVRFAGGQGGQYGRSGRVLV